MAILLCTCAFNGASAQLFGFNPFKKTVKVALVLPFNSESEDPSRDCMDFYSGALMAIDAKKAEGVSIKLKVVDFSAATFSAEAFAEQIAGFDAVVGPFALADIKKVLPACKEAGVAMISPLDQKAAALTAEYPLFFQVATPHSIQVENLVQSMDFNSGDKVTVFYKSIEEPFTRQITEALDKSSIPYHKISYNVQRGRAITDSLKRAILPGAQQHVFIASEDEAFASDVARNINLVRRGGVDLAVYGSNRLRNFETIDAEVLYNLGLHIATGYFIDYRNTETQNFVLKYRSLFKTEPTQYAFSGYDVFYFFISAINDLGASFREFVPYYTLNLLQSNILFRKDAEDSGYVNIRTRDVEYTNDFSISVN